jgi:glycosyltransferase involved in cell wall biosynthesis
MIIGQSYHCIFINYFIGCFIIPFIYRRKYRIHLNIVSGSVSPKSVNRNLCNFLIGFESYFFNSVCIISEGLQNLLKVSRKAYILPLGANPVYVNRQNKYRIHLLYVGTLTYRRLEDTIEGLKLFLERLPQADIHYTIIGNGWHNEEKNLLKSINQLELQKHIELTGYIPNNELISFYEKANVGVSYIPITPYYEYQPATKTFEYLMAGMPVIATKTYENKQVVNQLNGVLISDDAKSFADGIAHIYNCVSSFNENEIRQSVEKYEWVKIVQTMKETILPTLIYNLIL